VREALRAQELLATDWGVSADVWSATSWTELRREALACESWNMLHPDEPTRVPYVTSALSDAAGPVVTVSDWIKAVPDRTASSRRTARPRRRSARHGLTCPPSA